MLKKNEIIRLEISGMTNEGNGVGKHEGIAVFVPFTVIGDVIECRIVKVCKTYCYGIIENIVSGSVERTKNDCPVYSRCGGCCFRHMSYEEECRVKEQFIKDSFERIGKLYPEYDSFEGCKQLVGYRNKAQFPIGVNKDGQPVAGFYAARTHNIIPVEDCKLGVTQNEQILGTVLSYMRENGVRPYDETTGKGLVRHVLIRYGFTSKELMVCLVINGETLPQEKKLVDVLRKIEGMTSISVNINRKNTNVILGEETRTVWGSDYITDQIHLRDCDHDFALTDTAIAYHISPQSFYQVNPVQTEKLYSLALSYAGLTGRETVWDLYCGIGTISLFLAQKAGKVYGVEIVPQAIEDAKSNAALNGITNASFFVGKAEEVLPEFYEKESRKPDADMLHPDVIVVDPPRKGCDEKCLETMLRMEPDRIVYVSCDPATLARDLKILCGGGYALRKVRPVDQFGHTTHVESVVLMQYCGK